MLLVAGRRPGVGYYRNSYLFDSVDGTYEDTGYYAYISGVNCELNPASSDQVVCAGGYESGVGHTKR